MSHVKCDPLIRAELLELPIWFADALNRKDSAAAAETFLSDGSWDVSVYNPDWVFHGRDAIKSQIDLALNAHNWIFQWVNQSVILECRAEEATVRTSICEQGKVGGNGVIMFGIFHDTCRKDAEGRWLFASRHFDLLYRGTPDLTAK